MKKIVKILSVTAAGLMLFAFTNIPSAAGSFEGVITYTMKFGGDVPPQAASMMQGSTFKIYTKGDKSRVEFSFAMGKTVTISDRTTKQSVAISDMMGRKYEVKTDGTKKNADDKAPDIKYLDDTKTIAGYTCKHAQATVTGKSGESYTSDIFYTDQLPYSEDMGQYKGLKGFPLSFETKQRSMNIYFTAESVTAQSVPDSLFVVPTTGYKVYNSQQEAMEDMQKSMKSGGGGE
jgi:GLPGLI family protein